MGWWSSDEMVTIKASDSTGTIHNNIVFSSETGDIIRVLLILITILKLMEFAAVIYANFVRKIKKRYSGANPNI